MSKIAERKDGSFYYIEDLTTLDEAFCNALGEIISVVASDVNITLNHIGEGLAKDIRINRTYGNMWNKINSKLHSIKLGQLPTGIAKNYVFEVEIPAIEGEVGDVDREVETFCAYYEAKNT